jgi:hypothetical protein
MYDLLMSMFRSISTFSRGRKIAVYALLILIVLTWLAVCLVIASYPVFGS